MTSGDEQLDPIRERPVRTAVISWEVTRVNRLPPGDLKSVWITAVSLRMSFSRGRIRQPLTERSSHHGSKR